MADSLLNKVINDQIPSKLFVKWLSNVEAEKNEDFTDIQECKVSQIDFTTFFLNFVHDEVQCNNTLPETPQKLNTPKRIEKRPKPTPERVKLSKTNLFDNNKTDEDIVKTPKSNPNLDYFSPISPLYDQSRHSFESTDKPSLCLGDFITTSPTVHSGKKKKKPEPSRRIKPTVVNLMNQNIEFKNTANSFNFNQQVVEQTDQKQTLSEERKHILLEKDSVKDKLLPIVPRRQNSLNLNDIKPVPSKVTYKSNLNNVITIYRTILDQQLILNITSEIYFLISVALMKQFEKNKNVDDLGVDIIDAKELDNSQIFESIHNVVYFTVKILESQFQTIMFYDKTTLRLLSDNNRFKRFAPDLSKKLAALAEMKAEKPIIELITPVEQTNVCFNIDTDNIDNFPDQVSFHAFKKQRDLFYEILTIWENQHLSAGWNVALALSGKIRSLFNMQSAPVGYLHLARLFKNQLLSSCSKGPTEKGLSEQNLSFLPSLPIDADKLNRLTNRLVTKQSSSGINSIPAFSGYQEFFKEFIMVGASHHFIKHLSDCLICDILEMNNTKFMVFDEEGSEVDADTRKIYVSKIRNLRLLGKFLGLIESLPYKTETVNTSGNVLNLQIEVRKQNIPNLDTKSLLASAITNQHIILIVPWLTEYLAQLDYVSFRLPYYISLFSILFDLYRNYESGDVSQYNAALVKFCLGWLFELPHFPEIEYFNYCGKQQNQKVNGQKDSTSKLKHLDSIGMINQSVLYLCCPYLEEIKKILSENVSNSKVSARYITPITTIETNSQVVKRKAEQQLEEAFLNGQPISIRKTVEFISERIASTVVKHICHNIVPKSKDQALKELKIYLQKAETPETDDSQRMAIVQKHAIQIAQTHLTSLLQVCQEEFVKISNEKIELSIDSLLPVDCLKETKNVCVAITKKTCNERVNQWISGHLNLTIFTKDFDGEIQKEFGNGKRTSKKKQTSYEVPSGGRDCSHNDDTLNGFQCLNRVRELCCELTTPTNLQSNYIVDTLEAAFKGVTERNDVNDTLVSFTFGAAFDMYLLIISRQFSILPQAETEIKDVLIKMWQSQPQLTIMFKTLFSPRNVKMLNDSSIQNQTWDQYAKMISRLLDAKLIDHDDLESQCTGFYNRNWDEVSLDNFSYFLKKLVSYRGPHDKEAFAYLLNFLSDFCSDL